MAKTCLKIANISMFLPFLGALQVLRVAKLVHILVEEILSFKIREVTSKLDKY